MPGEPGGVSNLLRRLFGKEFASSECATIVANGAKSPARPLVASRIVLSSTTATEARLMLRVIDLDERPRPRIGVLRGAFGLTEAEARLAARLACGDSLQEIAADHKVAIDTPRAQLKSVLAKTQTHRQAELVALINRLTVLP
jgi:DNA-binding CsgD family transcriptional regulator